MQNTLQPYLKLIMFHIKYRDRHKKRSNVGKFSVSTNMIIRNGFFFFPQIKKIPKVTKRRHSQVCEFLWHFMQIRRTKKDNIMNYNNMLIPCIYFKYNIFNMTIAPVYNKNVMCMNTLITSGCRMSASIPPMVDRMICFSNTKVFEKSRYAYLCIPAIKKNVGVK